MNEVIDRIQRGTCRHGPESAPASGGILTVSEILDTGAWPLRQRAMVALAALAIVMDGFDGQLIGYAAPAIIRDWSLAKSAFAFIVAVGLVGMAIGSAAAGAIGDRFGRRAATIGSVLLFGIATVASGLIQGTEALALCRFVTGIGVGGALPSATTYAAEFAPTRHRTMAVTATIIFVPVGGMLAGLFASLVLSSGTWRQLFIIGGMFPVVLSVALALWLVESPRWLAERCNGGERLHRVIKKVGGRVPNGFRIVADSDREPVAPNSRFRAVFEDGRLVSTLCLWASCFLVLLSVYTAFSWLPTMITAEGGSKAVAAAGLTTYNLGGVVGGMFCAWAVTRYGSRWPLTLFCAGGAGSAFLLSRVPVGETTPMIVALGIHGLFVTSVQCLLYSLAAHVYPTSIRARGTAATLVIGRLGAITSAFLGAAIISGAGSVGYFATLGLAMLGALAVLAILPRHIPAVRIGA